MYSTDCYHRPPQHHKSSDISVSKINLVSITVLCVINYFPFLLYFYFEKLFRFSFSFHFSDHFYFSFNFSFYFSFQLDYEIYNTHITTLLHKSNLAMATRHLLVCRLLSQTVTQVFVHIQKHASPDF